jgi:hypothetical protein
MGEAPTESDENRPSAAPRFFNELRATFGSGPGLRAFLGHGPQNGTPKTWLRITCST